jgi:hypothetical protein
MPCGNASHRPPTARAFHPSDIRLLPPPTPRTASALRARRTARARRGRPSTWRPSARRRSSRSQPARSTRCTRRTVRLPWACVGMCSRVCVRSRLRVCAHVVCVRARVWVGGCVCESACVRARAYLCACHVRAHPSACACLRTRACAGGGPRIGSADRCEQCDADERALNDRRADESRRAAAPAAHALSRARAHTHAQSHATIRARALTRPPEH